MQWENGSYARLEELEAHAAREGGVQLEEALAFLDALPAVPVHQLLGSWRGSGLATGHPWDGLLETFGWHGKRFESPDAAHPLMFEDHRGLFSVNPAFLPVGLAGRFPQVARSGLAGRARGALRLFHTSKPKARLRMTEYRGIASATMIYDALPINDHFRLVDDDTLIGAMDMRGVAAFLFVLRREAAE